MSVEFSGSEAADAEDEYLWGPGPYEPDELVFQHPSLVRRAKLELTRLMMKLETETRYALGTGRFKGIRPPRNS